MSDFRPEGLGTGQPIAQAGPTAEQQEVLARLGGTPRPLLRTIVAPSEKRIRTLIQELDAENLDQIIGGWLRDLAGAGRLEHLLTAIAIDGNGCAAPATGRSSCSPRCCTSRRSSPPTRPTPSGRPRNTSPGPEKTAAGDRTASCSVSLLYHAGVTEITRTIQAITRDRTRMLSYLPL
jgi:hypothetical protein